MSGAEWEFQVRASSPASGLVLVLDVESVLRALMVVNVQRGLVLSRMSAEVASTWLKYYQPSRADLCTPVYALQ